MGADVFLKLELFQRTGSFKPRGVLSMLSTLSTAERSKGVVSLSAGNHAQALAWAASAEGIKSTIVMPATAVPSKIEATRGYGGEVVLAEQDLLGTFQTVQRERDLTFVPPFDHPAVIAGTATLGAEIAEDAGDVHCVVVPCGGGGLLSGVAAAVKGMLPGARVIGVEPTGANVMIQSLAAGKPLTITSLSTIADGLAAPFIGVHTLAHVRALVDAMVEVEDHEIVAAMRVLMERCKILVEPAGAAAVAAMLSGRIPLSPKERVVAIVSGGNVDLNRLKSLL